MVMVVALATQTSTLTSVDGSTHYRIKVAETSAYVCVHKTYMSPLRKVIHSVKPFCTLVLIVFVDSLAIPTSPNIVNVFVSC